MLIRELNHRGFMVGLTAETMESGVCDVHGTYSFWRMPDGSLPCPNCIHDRIDKQRLDSIKRLTERTGLFVFMIDGQTRHSPPLLYENATFETFQPPNDVAQARLEDLTEYANAFPFATPNMTLVGMTGTGKTHLVISIGRRLSERGYRVIYTTAFDLMSLSSDRRRQDEFLQYSSSFDALIVDEVGAVGEDQTGEFRTVFRRLINSRYSSKLASIIVSNMDMRQLGDEVGARAVDRLMDGYTILFDWPSRRGLHGAE